MKLRSTAKWLVIGELAFELLFVPTSVFAGSGQPVAAIVSAGDDNPYCVQFWTANDGTLYGFSINDPSAPQTLMAVNFSHQAYTDGRDVPVQFRVGPPPVGKGFNPKTLGVPDCDPNTIVHVRRVGY